MSWFVSSRLLRLNWASHREAETYVYCGTMVTVPNVTRVADGDRKAIAWVHPAGHGPFPPNSVIVQQICQNPDLNIRRDGGF
jgi:hypothetical protein